VFVLGTGFAGWWWTRPPEDLPSFQTAEVTRGDSVQAVTATGQLKPVSQVEVGRQDVQDPPIMLPLKCMSRLPQDPSWHPETVKAFLSRLVAKKALGFKKQGRAYLYRPLVTGGACLDAASKSC